MIHPAGDAPGPAARRRRRVGYRLLGPAFDYLLHLRPAEWPIIAVHFATGTVLAVGFGGWSALDPVTMLLGGLAWVIALNGGTLAINSAFDQDTEDIAYLRSPPPAPRHLLGFGLFLMVFGLGASWRLDPGFRAAYVVCLALSLLYSVPPARLKAVPGLDWLINMWGFGTLTPFAGWALTGAAISPHGKTVLLAFCPLFAALYPLTQLYQLEADRARGDDTMASALGIRTSLKVALGAATIALMMLAYAGGQAGWSATPGGGTRWIGLALAAGAWLAVLVPWLVQGEGMTPAQHQRRMYHALGAWAVTDVAVLYGFGW